MTKIKEFLAKKGVGFYIMLGAVLFAFMGVIAYSVSESSATGRGVSPLIVVMLVLAIVAGLAFCWKDFLGFGPIVLSILLSIALGAFIYTKFNDFTYVYYGVGTDGQDAKLSAALLSSTIFFAVMWLAAIASAFVKSEKTGANKEAKK
ncbi:MAG: hypothetical protein LBL66_01670 [Clostridiales bacterium]|jgi:hypothetical protein|nr:hypothetical protein [Clostridiales bacterium]